MDLVLGSRFAVMFFARGVIPNPFDIRFQRVSGLTATVQTSTVHEGGENRFSHRLPKRVDYGNLVLERGFMTGSPLAAGLPLSPLDVEFNKAMTLFQFSPSNVLVSVLGESGLPIAGWMFIRAYPVRWATADLTANEGEVLIDTLELSYQRMRPIRSVVGALAAS